MSESAKNEYTFSSFQNITNVVYINLESRKDRRQHIEKELKDLGLKGKRFNAIKMENGAIGCSMSHLKCLQNAKENGLSHVMILEDDVMFHDKALFVKQINGFMANHAEWDVILVAGNNQRPYAEVDEYCVKPTKCQTTTGYIVKQHYFDILISNIKEGLTSLILEPKEHRQYAIDKYWFHLQSKDRWYLIIPLTVTQLDDYSDIEKKETTYATKMLQLDKNQFNPVPSWLLKK